MELAHITFGQIMTMVILMCAGFLCAKTDMIDDHANKKISSLLIYIVGPALIFMSYQRPFEQEVLSGLFLAFICAAISFAVTIIASQVIYRKKGDNNYAIERLTCVYSNCGFIGIPLVHGVFGSEGVFYITSYLTIFNICVWSHGVIVIKGQKSSLNIIFKQVIRAPIVIGALVGITFFLTGIILPDILANPLNVLSSVNTPLAMIVAGVSISRTNVKKVLTDLRIYKVSFVRLIAMPLLTILVLSFLDIPLIIRASIAIAAACPGAAMTIILAQKYDGDYLFASEIFAVSTLFSMITIPFVMLFV